MKVAEHRIAGFKHGEKRLDVTIMFQDGSEKYDAFLAHNAEVKLRSAEFVEQLGLDVALQGFIATQPPFGEASVPGVFVAGAASGAAGHVQSRMLGQASMGDFFRAAAQKK
ncbi:hypothetical protein BU23DRAFT_563077 [Bimuria novae-zelandiae CBS 107.79]|uniref:FAD/NAD(P)-binding domain-containing protein n=1 Tax=Bimuria novae-zelandiae CBS 107.79 TaxID=1447943 RepID=A0A6A5VR15_9PLEO|nr:hypothetical protein BU23DRAFT_563077 [Bimuria novae-zelandiae CBS 107.79]